VRLEVRPVPVQQSWWLHDKDWTAEERRESVVELIEETLRWLLAELSVPGSSGRSSSTSAETPSSE